MTYSVKRAVPVILAILLLAGAYFLLNGVLASDAAGAGTGGDTGSKFMLDVIDCGQGDSILARTPDGFNILIDTGDTDATEKIVSELDQHRVDHIDMLIITHPHADHIGGLKYIIENYRIGKLVMTDAIQTTHLYTDALKTMKQLRIEREHALPGKTYTYGKLQLYILGPLEEYEALNNMSVVVKMAYGENTFLLMGDAESEAETDMRQEYNDIEADVLKVAHHGSSSSTTKKFLEAVDPSFAAISTGDNDYDHPNPGVVSRLMNSGATVYRTDRSGSICFYSDGKTIEVKTSK